MSRVTAVAATCIAMLAASGTTAAHALDTDGWTTYGTNADIVLTAAESVGSTTFVASSPAFSAATVTLAPAAGDDGGGYTCAGHTATPTGYYDRESNTLYAHVDGYVQCNFDAPWISFVTQFVVEYDPANPGGTIRNGPTTTCGSTTSRCAGGIAYYNVYTCNGRYDHYGTIRGQYRTPDGKTHNIANAGSDAMGGHNAGQSMSQYC